MIEATYQYGCYDWSVTPLGGDIMDEVSRMCADNGISGSCIFYTLHELSEKVLAVLETDKKTIVRVVIGIEERPFADVKFPDRLIMEIDNADTYHFAAFMIYEGWKSSIGLEMYFNERLQVVSRADARHYLKTWFECDGKQKETK